VNQLTELDISIAHSKLHNADEVVTMHMQLLSKSCKQHARKSQLTLHVNTIYNQ